MTKILLYDNSNEIRKMVKKVIYSVSMSSTITECYSPDEISENLQNNPYDSVIIDIDTLGGNFLQLLEDAKSQNPKVLIIILTSYPNPRVQERLKFFGIEYYFDKNDQLSFFMDFLSFLPAKSPDENNNLVYNKVYQMEK